MTQPPRMPEAPLPGGTVADAPRGNWVDTLAPAATRPYLRLSRADRPIGTWLLWLPCLWAIALAAALFSSDLPDTVICTASGGNVDAALFADILTRFPE